MLGVLGAGERMPGQDSGRHLPPVRLAEREEKTGWWSRRETVALGEQKPKGSHREEQVEECRASGGTKELFSVLHWLEREAALPGAQLLHYCNTNSYNKLSFLEGTCTGLCSSERGKPTTP